MDLVYALLALFPLFLPVLWLWRLLSPRGARRWVVLGYGLLAGLTAWPLLLRLLDALGLLLTPPLLWAVAFVLALATVLLPRGGQSASGHQVGTASSMDTGSKLLCLAIGVLIAWRLSGLALEIVWRPLSPWDALMHWATKARVWSAFGELLPFVDNAQWLAAGDPQVFTDHHPAYPATIPLLQTWIALALGHWHPSLINLPWLLCAVALFAGFFGQARESGLPCLPALLFTWFLVSMPLLDSHIALAGYADLFLGAAYAMALMALHGATQGGSRWQWPLVLIGALACPLIKNEGFFWMLTLLPACYVVWRGGRGFMLALAAVLVVALCILLFFPQDLVVAGHSLASLELHYRPGSFAAIGQSLFLYDNWHLGAWLLLCFLSLAVWRTPSELRSLAPLLVAIASAFVLFLFLFTSTSFAVGALRQTAVGRITLHLMPACIFLSLLLYSALGKESGDT